MRYKYILFDFDGTLVNTAEALSATVNETLAIHGLGPLKYVENGHSIKGAYSKLSDKIDPEILRNTHLRIQEKYFNKNELFPNVVETLQKLKNVGHILAIVTTANKQKIHHLLNSLQLTTYFQVIITEADVQNTKPHPEPFQKAYASLGLTDKDKINTIMVGDSEPDIVGARNFGIDVVGVTYGTFRENAKQYNPTYVINSLTEVLPIVGIPYE